jgi:hypothetical protein
MTRKEQFNLTNSYQISHEEAVTLIYAFLLENPFHANAANAGKVIGGTIGKDAVKSTFLSPFNGLMCWYCLSNNSYYLAFDHTQYDPDNIPEEPATKDDLIYPRVQFKMACRPREKDINDILHGEYSLPQLPGGAIDVGELNGTIPMSDVIRYKANRPADRTGTPYNYRYCSFFENIDHHELRDLLLQEGAIGLRYYFGYDVRDLDHIESNRIRIIFFAVGRDGKNIMPARPDVSSTSILQNSWPPPPPPPRPQPTSPAATGKTSLKRKVKK